MGIKKQDFRNRQVSRFRLNHNIFFSLVYACGIVKNIDANNLSFPTLYGKPLQILK